MANGIRLSFCLLLLVNYVICNDLKFQSTSQDLKLGMSLQLTCSAPPGSIIDHWIIKRSNKVILKSDPNVKFLDPSVSHWKYNVKGDTSELMVDIQSLACSDNGTFDCIALKGTLQNKSNPLELYVKAPPENVEIRSNFVVLDDKEFEFTVGKQIHLICNSHIGNPPGEAHWFITNTPDKPESFRVITENISSSDPKALESSCQTSEKISLKYYPNREMKVAIKCGVNNTVGEKSFMRIFNIVKKEEKDSSKLIIIVVLCVIIPEIIIAIILGVVLYIRRKRAKKREADAAAAEAEADKALADREYSNNIPMKNINKSSVGGRRNRDSRNDNDQEKQAMTAYQDDPEA